jgi:nitrogen regulatory protein PII
MRALIIVARESMISHLEEFLRENGVLAYTILGNVMGTGVTGRVYGAFLHPDINAVVSVVLPDDQVERAIRAIKALIAQRKETAHDDNPIPLKVFSFPCEEHV